ncbi:T9SS type A sorting domain-containing protein [Neolewinella litorea]|uniref:T9SS type A sorting domain-containing protein n=1 Tax=Neolewinella litorea TaxID=2562452 RepID=A0A4S4NB04_9BACT|nr:T9SS type A sorting domain-containing protein [Neolewinella litorea]THH36554.1 T9SS type A sorting domain-containing protein [Neolewinella litorea]
MSNFLKSTLCSLALLCLFAATSPSTVAIITDNVVEAFTSLNELMFPTITTHPPNGGRIKGSTTFTASTASSDYYIDLGYGDLADYKGVCPCSENLEIIVGNGKFITGDNLFRFSLGPSDRGDGTYRYGVGPGVVRDLYPRALYTGTYAVTLSCGQLAWISGTCYEETRDASDDTNNPGQGAVTGSTAPLYPPRQVTASGDLADRIVITWEKGTDTPDDRHFYQIRRDGALIATVPGSNRSYTDSGLGVNVKHNYTVSTYYNRFGNTATAPSSTAQGSTFSLAFEASDGTKYNSTVLKWTNMARVAQEVRVERVAPGEEREELAVLSANSQGFNDTEGIPGFQYTYYITPIGSTIGEQSDTGHSRPNGVIKGYVRSSLGTGVPGVTVKINLVGTLTASGANLPGGCLPSAAYCATTDQTGYYEVRDIYYHEEAKFSVTPEKTGSSPHVFAPTSSTRTLDVTGNIAPGVDFNDLTVFTILGRVHYPTSSNNATCGVEGVNILVDNEDVGIRTDGSGNWAHVVQDKGIYSFTPEFLHHTFISTDPAINPAQLNVDDDVLDVNFTDTTTDSLRIIVQGGCGISLGPVVIVELTAPNNCYYDTIWLDESGVGTITDLPARNYQVKVVDIPGITNKFDILDQIGVERVGIDLTVRDTAQVITVYDSTIITPRQTTTAPNGVEIEVTPADTIFAGTSDTVRRSVDPEVAFIYRSPLDISTDFAEAGANVVNCGNEDVIVMEQGLSYTLQIDVAETLGSDCPIDTGVLKIYDFISDRGEKPIILPIQNGIVTYTIVAGQPNLASAAEHSYEKLLYIIPEVDQLQPVPVEYWAFVEGVKTNTPSFISRSPEIPMLILHDPPGDNSYSYVEEGTSFTSFNRTEVLTGGEAGFYTNTVIGTAANVFSLEIAAGVQIQLDIRGGRDNFNRTGTESSVTFLDRFSTSDLDNLTGGDGDVYIGAAFNQEFSIGQELTFEGCEGKITNVPAINIQDFATTFVYTELHIKNVLIPTLGQLRRDIIRDRAPADMTDEERREANLLRADSLSWENILAENDTARTEGKFVENISFSAGANVSREKTETNAASNSYEYNTFMNTDFAIGVKAQIKGLGAWFETETGGVGSIRYSTSVEEGSSNDTTRTVGYVLGDGDIGDYFSVDILTDESYDVPAFRIKAGTSSCPQEPNTQARDRPEIQIFPPEITGVPADGTASFVCRVTNSSESMETREYHVRAVSTSNPDGAIISLGGQRINNGPASFFIPAGESLDVMLTVQRGPLASSYEDIGIMVYPPCEYELWQDNGSLVNADTAYIQQLNFATECTNVTLREPFDGWIINRNSANFLSTTFSGYDRNNKTLQELAIEIKPEGQGYREIYTVAKADLASANYSFNLDLTNFPDGAYTLRAKASCGLEGVTYSSEKRGIIDRRSLAPFGYPTPSDGFLRPGQAISVTFDKTVNCNFPFADYQPVYSLTRNDTGEEIPVSTQCSGQTVILVPGTPLTDRPELAGVELTARMDKLRDPSGNVQKYPTVWSFKVNAVPVLWDPSPIYYSGLAGEVHIVNGVLKNDSELSKPFTLDLQDSSGLVSYPVWLTPLQDNGTILPNDDATIPFAVDTELTPGIYTGTIDALIDGEVVSTPITVELLATPVNWPFNPADYEYSMTVVTNFSLDGSDTLLSDDERDLIGAFVDGEIRGVTHIEYLPTVDLYRAFLTVYSHTPGGNNGERINFRFWHALNGVEYGALEEVIFRADATIGNPTAPFILHPEGIFQVIPLQVGWNWVSLNVQTDDMSREHLLSSIVGDQTNNNVLIKSRDLMSVHDASKTWSGNLKTLALGEGYLLHLSSHPDTLKVVGLPSPVPIDVDVIRNWNWIGYPQLEQRAVNDVLAGLNATTGDVLKGRQSFTVFDQSATGWLGNLRQFVPGTGYKLFAGNTGKITYPAPKRSGYEVITSDFEHNMAVIGTFSREALDEDSYDPLDVVAFIGGNCRGIGSLEYVAELDAYRTFMLVHGNSDDFDAPIEFRIVNSDNDVEYAATGEERSFGPDLIVGSIDTPYPFLSATTSTYDAVPAGYALYDNVPNPARMETTISFRIPATEQVTIELLDLNGRLVRALPKTQYAAGIHQVQLSVADLPHGVYLYRVRTEGFSSSRKMIVQ